MKKKKLKKVYELAEKIVKEKEIAENKEKEEKNKEAIAKIKEYCK